ncbi:MAG: hypothetical protein KDE23_17575 [Caldilinea sp.]|nr:hypothetical protein [Caldilinea sp.]
MTPTPPTTLAAPPAPVAELAEAEPFEGFQATARPAPLALPATTAGFLFAAARTADMDGDTAARTYWLEEFQSHLEDNAS